MIIVLVNTAEGQALINMEEVASIRETEEGSLITFRAPHLPPLNSTSKLSDIWDIIGGPIDGSGKTDEGFEVGGPG